jgi:hypothetical protein
VKTWPGWRSVVSFSAEGRGVTLLHESPALKVVLVGLEVGQAAVPVPAELRAQLIVDLAAPA